MKSLFITILVILVALTSYSQDKEIISLWPGKVPGETEKKHPPVQTDDISRNVTRISNITDPALIVYQPQEDVNNGGAVIICPGGGYAILAIDIEGYEIAEWLNQLGYTAYVLQYRVPKKEAGALQDIQRAIKIVRSNSKIYKINPNKIGVLGFSAGGNLSARACTNYNKETYSRVDNKDTISCKPDFAVLIYPAYLDKGKNKSLTPELKVNENTPPMFIFGTADDPYSITSALVMTGALKDAKVPVELHLLPRGGHGYGMRKGNIAAETWPKLAEKWLNLTMTND